jgi:hypothetical protein
LQGVYPQEKQIEKSPVSRTGTKLSYCVFSKSGFSPGLCAEAEKIQNFFCILLRKFWRSGLSRRLEPTGSLKYTSAFQAKRLSQSAFPALRGFILQYCAVSQ